MIEGLKKNKNSLTSVPVLSRNIPAISKVSIMEA